MKSYEKPNGSAPKTTAWDTLKNVLFAGAKKREQNRNQSREQNISPEQQTSETVEENPFPPAPAAEIDPATPAESYPEPETDLPEFSVLERQIVRSITHGRPKFIDMLNEVPPEDYHRVLHGIDSGFYGERDFENILQYIPEKHRQAYQAAVESLQQKSANRAGISNERRAEFMQKAQIDNDPFPIANCGSFTLTPEVLEHAGLAPCYELKLDQLNIGLSRIFRAQGHDSAIAYVQTPDGQVKVRSYYRSNSAGVWRYLPDCVFDEGDVGVWYGKGRGEEALTLPFELQKKLNTLSEKGTIQVNSNGINFGNAEQPPDSYKYHLVADFCFFGTGKRYRTQDAYWWARRQNALRGDYYKETKATPSYDFGHVSEEKAPPETVAVSEPDSPDFNLPYSTYQTATRLYGKIKATLFQSHNGKLRYTMCEPVGQTEQQGRAWVGCIETTAPVGSTGCRTEWTSVGDIGTPLYEYSSQADGYGDPYDTKGSYQNMWENYLSKIPLIRQYLHTTGKM